jgi:hypothetical protein
MYVSEPYLATSAALLWGLGMARADGVMPGFQEWMSRRFPAEGGHPSPFSYETLIALDGWSKQPHDLSPDETRTPRSRCVAS